MNASTPVLELARRFVDATDNAERSAALGDLYNALVRVEEPAGEPDEDLYLEHTEHRIAEMAAGRVAQSANADVRAALQVFLSEVRRAADALQETEYEPETVISALGYIGALQPGHAEDDVLDESVLILRAFLDGALPVPVGDDTEALRAALDTMKALMDACKDEAVWRTAIDALDAGEKALARVAGLEARDALVRGALEAVHEEWDGTGQLLADFESAIEILARERYNPSAGSKARGPGCYEPLDMSEGVGVGNEPVTGATDSPESPLADAVDEAQKYLGRAAQAEAREAALRDALRLAYTMLERASFDAHDRDWAREQMPVLRATLADSGEAGS